MIDGDPYCPACVRRNDNAEKTVAEKSPPQIVLSPKETLIAARQKKRTERQNVLVKEDGIPEPTVTIVGPKKGGTRMDTLVSEEVDLSEIPAEAQKTGKVIGRLGDLWFKLISAPAGKAQKVINRDRAHATRTDRAIRQRAGKEGRLYESKIVETTLYCWLTGGSK